MTLFGIGDLVTDKIFNEKIGKKVLGNVERKDHTGCIAVRYGSILMWYNRHGLLAIKGKWGIGNIFDKHEVGVVKTYGVFKKVKIKERLVKV